MKLLETGALLRIIDFCDANTLLELFHTSKVTRKGVLDFQEFNARDTDFLEILMGTKYTDFFTRGLEIAVERIRLFVVSNEEEEDSTTKRLVSVLSKLLDNAIDLYLVEKEMLNARFDIYGKLTTLSSSCQKCDFVSYKNDYTEMFKRIACDHHSPPNVLECIEDNLIQLLNKTPKLDFGSTLCNILDMSKKLIYCLLDNFHKIGKNGGMEIDSFPYQKIFSSIGNGKLFTYFLESAKEKSTYILERLPKETIQKILLIALENGSKPVTKLIIEACPKQFDSKTRFLVCTWAKDNDEEDTKNRDTVIRKLRTFSNPIRSNPILCKTMAKHCITRELVDEILDTCHEKSSSIELLCGYLCVYSDNIDMIKYMMEHANKNTVIHAIEKVLLDYQPLKSVSMFFFLCKCKKLNLNTKFYKSGLYIACQKRNSKLAKYLIKKLGNICHPFCIVNLSQIEKYKLCKHFLETCIIEYDCDCANITSLFYLVLLRSNDSADCLDLIQYFLQSKEIQSALKSDGVTIILYAKSSNIYKFLFGMYPLNTHEKFEIALKIAYKTKSVERIKFVLNYLVHTNFVDGLKETALKYAIDTLNFKIFELTFSSFPSVEMNCFEIFEYATEYDKRSPAKSIKYILSRAVENGEECLDRYLISSNEGTNRGITDFLLSHDPKYFEMEALEYVLGRYFSHGLNVLNIENLMTHLEYHKAKGCEPDIDACKSLAHDVCCSFYGSFDIEKLETFWSYFNPQSSKFIEECLTVAIEYKNYQALGFLSKIPQVMELLQESKHVKMVCENFDIKTFKVLIRNNVSIRFENDWVMNKALSLMNYPLLKKMAKYNNGELLESFEFCLERESDDEEEEEENISTLPRNNLPRSWLKFKCNEKLDLTVSSRDEHLTLRKFIKLVKSNLGCLEILTQFKSIKEYMDNGPELQNLKRRIQKRVYYVFDFEYHTYNKKVHVFIKR